MAAGIGIEPARGWEERLSAAARQFLERIVAPGSAGERELEATLLRLGFALDEVALLGRGAVPSDERLAAMGLALRRELDALSRRARAARADYDLNRHIAVFRAARRLEALVAGASPARQGLGARRSSSAPRSAATAAAAPSSIRL